MKKRLRVTAFVAAIFAAALFTAIPITTITRAQNATPSPALLVLNKAENSLAILDPATKQVVARIPTGEGPHEIAASADGKLAVVTNYGAKNPGHSLSVIDLVAQKEIHRVDLGPLGRPHGILFADSQFYFTAELNKLIARYDPATNKVDWLLGIGQNRTHMLVRTKYLNEFFTSNVDSGTVTAVEKSSDAVRLEGNQYSRWAKARKELIFHRTTRKSGPPIPAMAPFRLSKPPPAK